MMTLNVCLGDLSWAYSDGQTHGQESVLSIGESLTREVYQLLQGQRRKEALSLLVDAVNKAHGFERTNLMRRVGVVASIFLTNQTFQIYQDGLNLMVGKKYAAAREKFEQAKAIEPDNAEVLFRLGQCLFLSNELKKAILVLENANKMNPFYSEPRLWLGRALQQSGETLEAIRELRGAFREFSSSELAPVWLAEALYSAGQFTAALKVLEANTKTYPFHIQNLLTGARFRIQMPHADASTLWTARKDLQLAMSRLDQYSAHQPAQKNGEFIFDLRKSPTELTAEIQKLFQQVQGRLDTLKAQR